MIKIRVFYNILPGALFGLFGVLILLAIPQQIKISKYALYGARTYPYLSAMMIIVMSIATIISSYSKTGNGENGKKVNKYGYSRIILAIICIVFWVVMAPAIGFSIATFLFLLGMLLVMGIRNIMHLTLIPLLGTAINYYIFIIFFNIRI